MSYPPGTRIVYADFRLSLPARFEATPLGLATSGCVAHPLTSSGDATGGAVGTDEGPQASPGPGGRLASSTLTGRSGKGQKLRSRGSIS